MNTFSKKTCIHILVFASVHVIKWIFHCWNHDSKLIHSYPKYGKQKMKSSSTVWAKMKYFIFSNVNGSSAHWSHVCFTDVSSGLVRSTELLTVSLHLPFRELFWLITCKFWKKNQSCHGITNACEESQENLDFNLKENS